MSGTGEEGELVLFCHTDENMAIQRVYSMYRSSASLRGEEGVLANMLRLHQMRSFYLYCHDSVCRPNAFIQLAAGVLCGWNNTAVKVEERLHSAVKLVSGWRRPLRDRHQMTV